MCGIFKSTKLERFNELYDANTVRGFSSFGGVFQRNNKHTVYKTDDVDTKINIVADLYLGHLRAPTGIGLTFTPIRCHPFEYRNWLVAHNGILTNHRELTPDHIRDNHTYEIDSSVIPFQLHLHGYRCFEKFKGTWACWMYNILTRQLFITRSDNTLFVDPKTADFSSTATNNCNQSISPRIVYEVRENELIEVHSYQTKPLYFIP
jgi:glucosamine 6-phosphate synthetase-like amidotransferase/phosphosugar isomerase protein